jgi:hypothetical protein
MITCTALCHSLLEWQMKNGVHAKAAQTNLRVDRADPSNYFNYKAGGGKKTSCCAAMSRELLTSPGAADTYTFLINTSTTLPDSYQLWVYKNTSAAVKRQIQQAETPTPAVVISVTVVHVANAILLDDLSSELALVQLEIRKTHPHIPIDNN